MSVLISCVQPATAVESCRSNPYVTDWTKKKTKGTGLEALQPPPPHVILPSIFNSTANKSSSCTTGDYANEMVARGAKRWTSNRFPLRVYIAEVPGVAIEGSSYGQLVSSAFDEWCQSSNRTISWLRTADPNNADITVSFPLHCGDALESGETKSYSDMAGNLNHVSVSLSTLLYGRAIKPAEMKKTCLHELGHALGLTHSSNAGDIMFWQSNPAQTSSLCTRDANTIRRLYSYQ